MSGYPMILLRTDRPARQRLFANTREGRLEALEAAPPGSRLTACRWPAANEGEWTAGHDPSGVILDLDARF